MKGLDRALFRDVVIVAVFTGCAASARVAQEVAIAWRFGIGGTVDAYSFLMSLVNWPVSVWAGMLTVLLVPAFARLRSEAAERLTLFRAELLGTSLIVAAVGGALFWFGAHSAVDGASDRLSAPIIDQARRMIGVMSFAMPLGLLASLLSIWLLTSRRHSNTLLEGIPPLTIVGAILLWPSAHSSAPLLWGTVIGFGLRLFVVWALDSGANGVTRPLFSYQAPAWAGLRRAGAMLVIGQALTSVTVIVDHVFAAHLGEGAIATFNYASRIVGFVALLGATVIQRATLPIFSSAYASRDATAPRFAVRWTLFALVAGLVLVGLVVAFALPVTRLAFERGAFSADDTRAVSALAKYYAVHLPFYFGGLVVVSMMAARSMYAAIAVVAASNLIVKVLANVILMPVLGLAGIALSTAVMYAIALVAGYLAIAKAEGGFRHIARTN
jgi:peptidoglycan biosynthesis protein MviN/MurJ (putative lipid II flippase)